MSDQLDAFNLAWFAAMGSRTDRLRVSGMGNTEERDRPKCASSLLEDTGTVYDVSDLPRLVHSPGSLKSLAKEMTKPAKDHIVCCNPAVALCGADQRGEMFGVGAPDNKRMCSACASLSSDPHHKCCANCPGDAK